MGVALRSSVLIVVILLHHLSGFLAQEKPQNHEFSEKYPHLLTFPQERGEI